MILATYGDAVGMSKKLGKPWIGKKYGKRSNDRKEAN